MNANIYGMKNTFIKFHHNNFLLPTLKEKFSIFVSTYMIQPFEGIIGVLL